MRILLTAADLGRVPGRVVAGALADGWRSVNPEAEIEALGASDGDRGLLDAVEASLGGVREVVTVAGHEEDAAGRPVAVPVVLLESGGTVYLQSRDVLGDVGAATLVSAARGTSYGVGQLLVAAVERGARRVVVGAGIPATLDAGTGLLRALAGLAPRPFDVATATDELPTLVRLARGRLGGVELVLVAHEQVPARGLRGAAARLTDALGPAESQRLDTALTPLVQAYQRCGPRRADLLARSAAGPGAPESAATDPSAGSGGGLGLAVVALGGRIVAGPAFVALEIGLTRRAQGCDLVVVCGERIDPVEADRGVLGAVATAVAPHGVAVLALGETVQLDRRNAAAAGISATGVLEIGSDDLIDDHDDDRGSGVSGAIALAAGRHARAWRW